MFRQSFLIGILLLLPLTALGAKLEGINGKITIERKGRTLRVSKPRKVKVGDVVRTNRESRVQIRLKDGIVSLGYGSAAQVKWRKIPPKDKAIVANQNQGEQYVELLYGHAEVEVWRIQPRAPGNLLYIRTAEVRRRKGKFWVDYLEHEKVLASRIRGEWMDPPSTKKLKNPKHRAKMFGRVIALEGTSRVKPRKSRLVKMVPGDYFTFPEGVGSFAPTHIGDGIHLQVKKLGRRD